MPMFRNCTEQPQCREMQKQVASGVRYRQRNEGGNSRSQFGRTNIPGKLLSDVLLLNKHRMCLRLYNQDTPCYYYNLQEQDEIEL